MNRDTLRQVAVVLATLVTIAMNILANALPFNGLNTGEISDRFDVFFVPAGYVFAIWGLIYVAWLAYAVYQALPANKEDPDLRRIGWLFVLSCAANSIWLIFWHYEQFVLSVLAMLVLLGSLIAIYLRLDVGRAPVSTGMKWFVHLPFSIYLGWITVATIANITSALDYLEWTALGISGEVWTAVMLAVAVIVASILSLTRGDVAYSLVIIWSTIGIAVKHSDNAMVATAAWVATAIVAIMMIVGAYWHGRQMRELALTN